MLFSKESIEIRNVEKYNGYIKWLFFVFLFLHFNNVFKPFGLAALKQSKFRKVFILSIEGGIITWSLKKVLL
jgi:hypothetical protein